MYRIAMAGTGYVGLVTAVCLASKGFEVTCVDTDKNKIDQLCAGICPIYEAGLQHLMEENSERLTYTTDYQSAYAKADVIFIGVGTPERLDGSANLDYVLTVAEQIAECAEKDCVVVVKSTVPIGTNDRILYLLREKAKHPVHFEIASNPEFLSQGTAVHDTLFAARIVIGVQSERARQVLTDIYQTFEQPIIVTDIRSAEMIKYASNDFLALKISYINEIANLCEITGADVSDVARGMGSDPRIGSRFLKAGIGYGGSCFPKDTKALHWLGNYHGYELKTIKAAIEVNEIQKLRLVKKAQRYCSSLNGKKVAVLGLTFKPNTDDLRDAPALENVPILTDLGAHVFVWDPVGMENFKQRVDCDVTYCDGIDVALQDADLCMIFTEWPQIIQYDVRQFERLMKTPLILDGRNCYDLEQFEDLAVIYDSVGRKVVNHLEISQTK